MKKWATFVLCAVLITGLITRTIHLVSAQEETPTEETQAEKTQAEESSPQDSTEPAEEAGEYPEESHNDGEEQETEQPEQSESESPETSEESESDPSQSLPDGSDSEGESLPAAETDESGEVQTEEETPEVIEGEIPKEIPKEIPGGIPNGIPSHKESESNQDVVEAMQAAQDSLNEHIDYIAGLLDMTDGYDLIEGEDNFCEALAIYAIRHEQTENYPYEIEITGEEDFTQLQSIYWSLNAVNGAKTEGNSVIRVTQLSAVKVYNLSESQRDLFKKLNSQENREKVGGLLLD